MTYLLNLDYQVFIWFNHFAHQSLVLDWLIVFFAHYLPLIIGGGLVVVWLVKHGTRQAITSAFLALVLGRVFLVEFIRLVLPRDRPFLSLEVIQLIAKDAEQSFPSGHATALFAIAFAIYVYNKKYGLFLVSLAILVSLFRVMTGVHYPSDILAGALLGLFSAWVINRFLKQQIEYIVTKF